MDTIEQIVDIQTPEGVMAAPTYRPSDGQPRPAVIVIMEAFGVNSNIIGITQRVAAAGYVAATPDLFHRAGRLRFAEYDKLQESRAELRKGYSDDSVLMDLRALVRHLESDPGVQGRIGIVGFCLGGRVSYMAAANVDGIAVAAVYYGGFMIPADDAPAATRSAIDDAPKVKAPIIGFFGNDDGNPSPEVVQRIDAELTKHGKQHEFHRYDGAGHGFVCDERDSYRPDAAADAWEKTLAFFAKHLA